MLMGEVELIGYDNTGETRLTADMIEHSAHSGSVSSKDLAKKLDLEEEPLNNTDETIYNQSATDA